MGPGAARAGPHEPRPRGVLAFLLLNANTVVLFDRLIDAMWGDAAPTSARTQSKSDA